MNNSISPWPLFTQKEADAISKVLLSNKVNYWTGNEGRQFEKEFANWCESNYAVVWQMARWHSIWHLKL